MTLDQPFISTKGILTPLVFVFIIFFFMSCNLFELVAKEIAGDPESDMGTWKKEPLICQYSKVEITFLPMGYKFKPLEALGEVDVKKTQSNFVARL